MNAPNEFIQANMPALEQPEPTVEVRQQAPNQMLDWLIRGGPKPEISNAYKNIMNKKIMRGMQAEFERIIAAREQGADELVRTAKKKYGDKIGEYLPPKELFYDQATGQFMPYKYAQAVYVGTEEFKKIHKAETEKARQLDIARSQAATIPTGDYRPSEVAQDVAEEHGVITDPFKYIMKLRSDEDAAKREADRLAQSGKRLRTGVASELRKEQAQLFREQQAAQKLVDVYTKKQDFYTGQMQKLAKEKADLSKDMEFAFDSSDIEKRIRDIDKQITDYAEKISDLEEKKIQQEVKATKGTEAKRAHAEKTIPYAGKGGAAATVTGGAKRGKGIF